MKDRLVAHRGDMVTYPENSLLALQAAANLGFRYLELDVQFSKDITPFVIHDENLIRTGGTNKNIYESFSNELLNHRLLYNNCGEENDALLYLAPLEKAVEMLNKFPGITLFVEIKRQTLDYLDLDIAVDAVLKDLEGAAFKFVIISFVKEVVEYVQQKDTSSISLSTGWVLSQYDQASRVIVNEMQPDYLFCNVTKVNKPDALWGGPWKWVLYDIMNPAFAYELLAQGVDLIETGDIVKLSQSEYFES